MVLKDWITGVLIPIIAVFIGSIATIFVNRRETRRGETTTRGKILMLMAHELKGIIDVPTGEGKYSVLQFHSGEILLQSTAFTVELHKEIIDLTIDIIATFQRFQLGLNALPTMWGPMIGEIGTPKMGNIFRHAFESLMGEEHAVTRITKEAEHTAKSVIDENMEVIRPLAQRLLNEVQLVLNSKSYIQDESVWVWN